MPTGSSASGLRGAAHDHPAGRLDLHAIALVRDEVPAAEYVFEEPEEHLDDPPLSVVLRDQFSALSSAGRSSLLVTITVPSTAVISGVCCSAMRGTIPA